MHIAKDNKQFNMDELQDFFLDINNLKEQYRGGLKVAQGADMNSI
jgi:hypothetical protein